MDKKLLGIADLEIWKRGERYFVRYDAGTHQITLREDEISESEANLALTGEEHATKMLFTLQKRLIAAGIDPYKSNTN